jgi:hypothetical protein
MTGDRTTTDPESGKAQPADESRAKPPMDELSRRHCHVSAVKAFSGL